MSVVNHKTFKGKEIVIQVAGGVQGDTMNVVKDDTKRVASSNVAAKTNVRPTSEVPANRWWWNGK